MRVRGAPTFAGAAKSSMGGPWTVEGAGRKGRERNDGCGDWGTPGDSDWPTGGAWQTATNQPSPALANPSCSRTLLGRQRMGPGQDAGCSSGARDASARPPGGHAMSSFPARRRGGHESRQPWSGSALDDTTTITVHRTGQYGIASSASGRRTRGASADKQLGQRVLARDPRGAHLPLEKTDVHASELC